MRLTVAPTTVNKYTKVNNMKRCLPLHRDTVYNYLREHHEDVVEALLRKYTKDAAAKMLRAYLHDQGITHADTVPISRAQLRGALVPWKRYGEGKAVHIAPKVITKCNLMSLV